MVRYFSAALMLLTFWPGLPAPSVKGQQPAEATICKEADASFFNFLIGKWRGEERASRERNAPLTSTSLVEIKPILGGCALQEHWKVNADRKKLFSAVLLRSFDAKSRQWMLSYVDDQLNSQVYEGRKTGNTWGFYRERVADGRPILVRIVWQPSPMGFVQTIERSSDGGQTWAFGSVITYTKIR